MIYRIAVHVSDDSESLFAAPPNLAVQQRTGALLPAATPFRRHLRCHTALPLCGLMYNRLRRLYVPLCSLSLPNYHLPMNNHSLRDRVAQPWGDCGDISEDAADERERWGCDRDGWGC